jgi:hypothetical protein
VPLDEDVVRPADHHEMFDIVAADKHKLPLAVETERVDQTQTRLARPPSRDPQPMREHHAIDDRQNHQSGEPAGDKNGYPAETSVAGEKVIQPLHAISNACAANRASQSFAPGRGDEAGRRRDRAHENTGTRRTAKRRRMTAIPFATSAS